MILRPSRKLCSLPKAIVASSSPDVKRGERTKSINSVVPLFKEKASGQRIEHATVIRSLALSRLLSCFNGNLFTENLFR